MLMSTGHIAKPHTPEEYVQIDDGPWAPFPDAFSDGGITWKLLHVSPESGGWTAIFTCPAGSSFAAHIHTGPGEYFLTHGRMDVRGGRDAGGDTAHVRAAPSVAVDKGVLRYGAEDADAEAVPPQ